MSVTPDDVLGELWDIRTQLEAMDADDPERGALETRRDELRAAAAEAADMSRNPEYLRHDLERAERRLAELEKEPIAPKLADSPRRRKYLLTDPFAYASSINETIEDATEEEREALERRIAQLKSRIAQLEASGGAPSSESSSNG